jgi:hypothetical protein
MDGSARSPVIIGPMGVGEVIDAGLKLARQNYRRLATIIAYAVVPAFVIGVVLDLILRSGQLAGVVTAIGQSVASIAVTIACSDLVAPGSGDSSLEVGPLYRLARTRIWRLILLSLLIGLLAIPLLIIFPLGIVCFIRWSMSSYAVIIEGDGPIQCLRRSWNLTKGAWWHTLGVLFVVGILYLIIAVLVEGLFAAIGGLATVSGSAAVGGFFITLGSAISGIFITPFASTIGVVLYYELRARHEGFDLESRARQQWQTP